MWHVVFKILVLIIKTLNYPILTGLDPILPPQTSKTTAAKEKINERAEPQQDQPKLITDDKKEPVKGDKDETLEEKNDSQTESNLGQLQVLEEKEFVRAKKNVEIKKN